jgi:hypothetical protein
LWCTRRQALDLLAMAHVRGGADWLCLCDSFFQSRCVLCVHTSHMLMLRK